MHVVKRGGSLVQLAVDLEVAVAKGFTPGSAVSQDPLRSWAEDEWRIQGYIGSHAALMLRSLKGDRGQ